MQDIPIDNNPKDDEPKNIIQFKILVVGASSVGKTSLVCRTVNNLFSEGYKATIGVDFASKTIRWNPDTEIVLHFWDLAGQDRFKGIVRAYYRETHGVLCVYDVMRRETKADMVAWRDLVEENCRKANGEKMFPPCVMLANKVDLLSGLDVPLDYDAIAREGGFYSGFPVSAKTGAGIDAALKNLIEKMLKMREEGFSYECPEAEEKISLESFEKLPTKSRWSSWTGWC